jgi:hypothetical protein
MRLLAGLPVLVVGALIATWLRLDDEQALRAHLTRWQFWALEAQFVLLVAVSWLCLPRFVRSLGLARSWVFGAGAASLMTFLLAAGVAPRTNRIYYDEHIYQGIGQNLSDLHLAQMCNDGSVEYGSLKCSRGEYNKQPYGYPYLLSLGYRLFGVHERIAHDLNLLFAVLLVWVVFLVTSAAFGDPRAGVYAAFVLALVPQQLLWSHTAAVEPSAALFSALSVLAALNHVRERSTLSLLWTVTTTAFAVKFRPESALAIPLAGLILAIQAPSELVRARSWLAAALGTVLCALDAGHLVAVRGHSWGASGAAMSLSHAWQNLEVNGLYYLDGARFPVGFTLLALLGLAAGSRRATGLVASWFLLFWGVFLFFYAGSYDYGADVRYSLMSYAPLAVLAGRGASWVHRVWDRLGRNPLRAWQALAAALFVQFLWYLPQVRAVGEEAWEARADVAFARRVIPELPRSSVVLTHNPAIFHVNGANAAQMSLAAADAGYVVFGLGERYAGGIFLHWNAWCNWADVRQRQFCSETLGLFPNQLFEEYRERDFRYAFYRLETDGMTLQRIE